MPAKDNLRKHLAQAFLKGEITWETMTDGIEETLRERSVCQSPECQCECCNKQSVPEHTSYNAYSMKGYPPCPYVFLDGRKCVKPLGHDYLHDTVYARNYTTMADMYEALNG